MNQPSTIPEVLDHDEALSGFVIKDLAEHITQEWERWGTESCERLQRLHPGRDIWQVDQDEADYAANVAYLLASVHGYKEKKATRFVINNRIGIGESHYEDQLTPAYLARRIASTQMVEND